MGVPTPLFAATFQKTRPPVTFNFALLRRLLFASLFRARRTPARLCPQRVLFLLFQVGLFFPLMEASHRLAWLLDDLLFPGYRRQPVREPVFIVAPHRSGTTLLLSTLARDPQFAPMDLWESFFAPSVTQRKIIWSVLRLDRFLGGPLRRLVASLERAWGNLPQNRDYFRVHRLSFLHPEEDAQLLIHQAAGYDLLAFFPFPDLLWDYADYSRRVSPHRRQREMAFYRAMLQRHLYAHGGGTHLSKPPTFSSAIPDLVRLFPDARFIHLVRHPVHVVPSSVALWRGHWQMNGCPGDLRSLARTVLEHNRIWYLRLYEDLAPLPPERMIRVAYTDLKADLLGTVERIYRQLGLPLNEDFRKSLAQRTPEVRAFRSRHRYPWREMGLTPEEVAQAFEEITSLYGLPYLPDDPEP